MKTNWPAFRCGSLLLAAVALSVPAVSTRAQEPARSAESDGAAVISSVAITQASERATVRVDGEGRLDARAARMQNPDRLVLDFVGARLAVQKTAIPGVSAPIRGVRLGQFKPDVVRIVIDLTSATPYQIAREGSALVISFEILPAIPAEQPGASAAPAPMKTAGLQDAGFFRTRNPRAVTARSSTRQGLIRAPHFGLPRELTQSSFALASLRTKPEGPAQQAAAPAAPQSAPVSAASAPGMKYTGEPISVNLKDVDLKDFFRLIHEISGLNVVLDPAVKGSLTIVLDEVPWDQALDIVLQNNGLDKQLNGNVLRIATHETMKKDAETQRDLQKAQSEAIDPITHVQVLSYAKAASLTILLKRFLSARGDILSDDRSNQLIIRDIPSVIPTIENLIRQLDRKSQQVEIEARVVSASRSFAQDIGTQLAFAGSTNQGRSVFGGASDSNLGVSPITTGSGLPQPPLIAGSSTTASTGMPFAVNLGAGAATSGLGFFHRSPNFALDFMITAAEAKGVGKLLSKPKVITQNNEKATVKQGTKIPIQTTINNTISVQFIDAVLKLEVTPQITADGTVFMDVLVENTQIDNGIPRVQGIPALNTQSAETKVIVADGGTLVLGGIIITTQRVDVTQVPIVGSLPIIGHLFKRTNTSIQSQELLFFLTPRIVPG